MFCINKRKTGSRYEEQAAAFLEKQGLLVMERNFRCKSGEIDLIARDGRYLVFVEVKYRSSGSNGVCGSCSRHGTNRNGSVVQRVIFLIRYGYQEPPCRFDVVAIDGEQIQWIKKCI